MTKEEVIEELKRCQKIKDAGEAHCDADWALLNFLISLGFQDIVDEWHKVEKWYS